MSEKLSNTKTLRDSSFNKDFGKCVLDELFAGWYTIHFYIFDAKKEEILARKLSSINKELLYLHDQVDGKLKNPPRSNDYRKYWEKMQDILYLEERKAGLIEKLKSINRQKKKQRPSY